MIARIVPLIRLPTHLDYFDYCVPESLQKDIRIGHVARIPFRKKIIYGIVVDLQKSTDANALKSIQKILFHESAYTPFQKEILSWFPYFYFVSPSTVARMMLVPPRVRKSREELPGKQLSPAHFEKKIRLSPASIHALRAVMTDIERAQKPVLFHCVHEYEKIALYAKCAQNTLKKNKQLLLLCPTIPEAEHIARSISGYISSPIALMHGTMRTSELRRMLERIRQKEIRIIIGTRMALFHAIPDLDTIIIDQSERMEHKQYDMHPRYHVSTVACVTATRIPVRVILHSHAPRIEDMHASERGELAYISLSTSPKTTPVIHLTQEEYIPHAPLISETLHRAITQQLANKKNIFLFLNKKGLSSTVVCQTCHAIFSCSICGRHRAYSEKTKELFCAFCNTRNILPDVCTTCKGSAFMFPGMGSEKIIISLKKLFPGIPIQEINRETSAELLCASSQSPSITVGTSYVPLSHPELFSLFSLVCILLADPSASLTDFRNHETQWQMLARILMLAHAKKSLVYMQAFQKDHIFISTLCNRDWKSFSASQLHQRKEFEWPPYSRLIALSHRPQRTSVDRDAVKNLARTLTRACEKNARVSLLSKRTATEQDRVLLILPSTHTFTEPLPKKITDELKKIPPGWLVDIDPVML
jgi:primosomal protein N' (replication factor Y)